MTLQDRLRDKKAGTRLAATDEAADALDAQERRIKELEGALRDLVERVDMAGGLGPYNGGMPFALNRAREALK